MKAFLILALCSLGLSLGLVACGKDVENLPPGPGQIIPNPPQSYQPVYTPAPVPLFADVPPYPDISPFPATPPPTPPFPSYEPISTASPYYRD